MALVKNYINYIKYVVMCLKIVLQPTLQECPQEIAEAGISVAWRASPMAENVASTPLCYQNETLLTRNCSGSEWIPALNKLPPCLKVVQQFDPSINCPRGYSKASNNNVYCYQVGKASSWDYPCFTSGGVTVITDLSDMELDDLIMFMKAENIGKYFWVPAHSLNAFHPPVWYVPGPNWNLQVTATENLRFRDSVIRRCLLLDIDERLLSMETCSNIYPSLCLYKNDIYFPARCPEDYYSFRLRPDRGSCYGIATADTTQGLSYNDFLKEICHKPMSSITTDINRLIFEKIAEIKELPDDTYCWFKSLQHSIKDGNSLLTNFGATMNKEGIVALVDKDFPLTCMVCEAKVIQMPTELMFEYNDVQNQIYLTIYNPSGLWRYSESDKGIQCFSDAKGFVRVIDINDIPLMDMNYIEKDSEHDLVEKVVYIVDLVTDSSAQYWCEGHTANLSLITTDKIIINPRSNTVHVYSLILQHYIATDVIHNMSSLVPVITIITEMFDAEKVLLMDISYYAVDRILLVLHLHISIEDMYDNSVQSIQDTLDWLKRVAGIEFPNHNYTLVNLASSVYCLPTKSEDLNILDWEMTAIGHIAAPTQFCLQSNGLPVKRRCEGSYMLGASWGSVEGYCDDTYKPTLTTKLLYKFVKRSKMYANQFLTKGLAFVLDDIDIIIPADIYYLSMSLQQISGIAQTNITSLDATDIEHISWVMDRVMSFDWGYLRLAQTLNSTNVIVDSISDIIEIIGKKKENYLEFSKDACLIAVQPQFMVQINDLDLSNMTGIAIANPDNSIDFSDMVIHPLYKNTTVDEVLSIEHLEIASWLPNKTIESIRFYKNSNNLTITDRNLQIIITVYNNDAVFQELENNNHIVNSRIIGISIPNYISNLVYPIPILFKQSRNDSGSFCGYWDFQPLQVGHIPGTWKTSGCFLVKNVNDVTVCECYHLTHFGQLLYLPNHVDDEMHQGHVIALNVITLVGGFLSLLGVAGIWITAVLFSNWRKKASTKVLLQLSTSIALPLLFIIIFNLHYSMFIRDEDNYMIAQNMRIACIALGALLHFSILASFMWMLITAVLQFIRYVRVLGVSRPARFMFKFTVIGWVLPSVPVIITLTLNSSNYVPDPSPVRKICYPNGYYLVASVLVPIFVILLVNFILFILVLRAISKSSNHKFKPRDVDLVGAQMRVSIFLFFLLGLTWVFGFLSFSSNFMWSYLFCFTSTLQGFVLFIYFVICDPNTRNLWITLMKPQFTNTPKNSITCITPN